MPGCRIVGAEKPKVWKDDFGWNCDQTTECLKCGDINFDRLVEDATWDEAVAAASKARPAGGTDVSA